MKRVKALAVAAFLVCAPAFAASDIFAKIGDIKGESQDTRHKDWIEISSFSWGANTALPAVQRGCATNEIRFALVKLTPELVQKCRTNEHLPEMVLDIRGEHHVLQGAQIRSCQNNMLTVRFDRCATHPSAPPLAASLVNPNAASNGQMLLGNLAENLNLIGVRPSGPNTVTVLNKNASSSLMRSCATGQHFKEAKITCRKAGKGQQEFLVLTLKEVVITSVQRNADGTASLGLRYGSMQGSLAGLENLQ